MALVVVEVLATSQGVTSWLFGCVGLDPRHRQCGGHSVDGYLVGHHVLVVHDQAGCLDAVRDGGRVRNCDGRDEVRSTHVVPTGSANCLHELLLSEAELLVAHYRFCLYCILVQLLVLSETYVGIENTITLISF